MVKSGAMLTKTTTLAGVALLSLVACSDNGSNNNNDNVVNVYNWADYIELDVLDQFEAETGIKVNYDTYDSSEVVDVKLLAGNSGYDVIVHSNQFSSRLAPIGVYEKLDMSKLPNMSNIDPDILAQTDNYEAVRGYNVPYHWGSTGYAWNVEMVRERLPDHPMDSADVIFDPDVVSKLADCGVTLLNGATDLIPMVLAYLGRDPNGVDDESLAAAEAQLKLVRPYIRYFSNDKYLSDMPNKEVCVAMSWSGDYATSVRRAREAGLDLEIRYTMPKEGSGLWVDGLYIVADAPHRENAYKFLNFVLRGDVAAAIANEVGYATANAASWPDTDPQLLNDPAIYTPKEDWDRMYPIKTPDPKRERPRARTFARVKAGID
jgi:putrescine transport system substrate-binding protein